MTNPSLWRILDANLNRAGEGARVVEEYARFVLESPALTQRCKELRHSLQSVRAAFTSHLTPDDPIERFRDTPGDVGTRTTTESESTRADAASVARASMKRLQEALRTLEEYGKVISGAIGSELEALRYQTYSIEPLLFAAQTRRERLRDAKLYVLITESLASTDSLTVCREAVAGGADLIQMREKEWEDGKFYEIALKMAEICRSGGALFLINDRPHLAVLTNADGIHTGQGDLPTHLTRRILGPNRLIGKSTSAPEFAEGALRDGADYIGVGPVYETNTKQHRAAVGLDYVRWVAEHKPLPYFCIGSINRNTLGGVLEAGARAVAVCTGIIAATDIAAETAWYKERLTAGFFSR